MNICRLPGRRRGRRRRGGWGMGGRDGGAEIGEWSACTRLPGRQGRAPGGGTRFRASAVNGGPKQHGSRNQPKSPEENPSGFLGDYSGTTSGIPRMQGTRRATGHSPLREGGGAAMDGMSMTGKRQATGAATGGVLREAVATKHNSIPATKTQALCGWTLRKHASTATRSTPPAALSIHSE